MASGQQDAIVVVVLLHGGGDETGDADAVAAHHHRLGLAGVVEIGGAHLRAVVRAEDEDVATLDAAVELEVVSALGAAVAFGDEAQIVDVAREVTTMVHVLQVVVGLVGASDRVEHVGGGAVDDELALEA